jgi:hypothetical protein
VTDERETRITTEDTPVTVVRTSSSAMPWIIAAIVAVVAILAVAFLMTNRAEPVTNADDLAAAMDAGRAAGYVEGATTAMSRAAPAPILVPSYDGSADRSAAEASAAAADARDAAERAADSAAAADTSVTVNTTP